MGTSHRRLCALISLGAGTLLGVTAFAIPPECLEAVRWWGVLLALASGLKELHQSGANLLSHQTIQLVQELMRIGMKVTQGSPVPWRGQPWAE